jgi:hypothetical protein
MAGEAQMRREKAGQFGREAPFHGQHAPLGHAANGKAAIGGR